MAQVPGPSYEPYFTGQAPERRLALREPNIPAAAFGVDIAHALNLFGEQVKGAGRDVETASNDIFNRAEALRKMQIESAVRDATTAHFNDVAPIQNDFLQKQGNNASPDAMAQHLDVLNQKRQATGDQIESQYGAYGRKLFDDQAASMQRSFTREAVVHSSTEFRKVNDKSIGDRIQALKDEARLTPANSERYNQIMSQELPALIREQSGLWGYDKDTNDYNLSVATSGLTAARIKGMADTGQPEQAAQLYMDSLKNGQLRGQDRDDTLHRVQGSVNAVGSRRVYESLRTGAGMELGKGIVDIDRAADAISSNEGSAWNGRGPLITTGDYKGQRALGKFQVMQGNLQEWLKEAGMPAMSEDQFLNDRAAQVQLFRSRFGKYMQETGNANDAASMWFTGKTLAEGAAKSDGHWNGAQYVMKFNQALARTATREEISGVTRNEAEKWSEIDPDAPGIWDDKVNDALHRDRLRDNANLTIYKQNIDDYLNNRAGHTVFDVHDMQNDTQGAALIEAIRRTPGGQTVIDAIDRNIRNRVAHDDTPSDARDANYFKLSGMSNDLDKQKAFANTDLDREDLTQSQRGELRRRKKDILAGKYDPERVKSVMHDLDPLARSNGIRRSDTDQAQNDRYLMFQGMVSRKLEEMAANNIPIPHEIDKREALFQPLMRSIAGTWSPWQWAHPYFEPPSGMAQALNAAFKDKFKVTRDMYPEEMGRAFENAINTPWGQEMLKRELGEERAKEYARP